MAGELYPVAGCRIYIGGVIDVGNADLTVDDFAGESWTEIDGYSQMGAVGDTAALITTPLINRSRDVKQKGSSNAGSMANVFAVIDDDPGQIAFIAAAQPNNRNNYAFKLQLNDTPAARSSVATITIATPGVLTWTAHGLEVGAKLKLSTTGALPTGLTPGTEYFVKTTPSADTLTLAATSGGAAIATSGTQSGTHTATSVPTPSERLFGGLVMTAQEQGGDTNTVRNLNGTVEINSNIVRVAPTGA